MALIENANASLPRVAHPSLGGDKARLPPPRFRLFKRLAIAMMVVAALTFISGFILFNRKLDQAHATTPRKTDAVVVVTGGGQRIGEGLMVLQSGLSRRLLISGVNERTGHDDVLKLHPSSRRLMSCCVDLGAQARNTIGNAIETRKWVRTNGFQSLTVVTSHYHMPRTLLELRHAMPGIEIRPHFVMPDAADKDSWWSDLAQMRLIGFEYMKFLVAALRVKVEADPETSRLAIIFGGRKPISPKVVSGTFLDGAH